MNNNNINVINVNKSLIKKDNWKNMKMNNIKYKNKQIFFNVWGVVEFFRD